MNELQKHVAGQDEISKIARRVLTDKDEFAGVIDELYYRDELIAPLFDIINSRLIDDYFSEAVVDSSVNMLCLALLRVAVDLAREEIECGGAE